MTFCAAIVQMRSSNRMEENLEAARELVREAAAQGAHYVQTPEMTGLVEQDRKSFFGQIRAEEDDPIFRAASEWAKELKIHLHIGSTPIRLDDGKGGEKAVNRALLFGPGGRLLARYDKLHMFDVNLVNGETWRESAVYESGQTAVNARLLDAHFGLAICYDVRFPRLFRLYARAGADVLTAPSCFTRQTGKAHWHVLMRARAIENGAFMIAAAQGGEHADGRETFGHSLIVNPWGEIIAELAHEESGTALAEIDLTQAETARARIPNLRAEIPFDLAEMGG